MEYRTLVYRILGVPDIIQVRHQAETAARRLLQRSSMPLDDEHIYMARSVLSGALMMCEEGEVDPLWGGWRSVQETAALLMHRLPAELPARGAAGTVAEQLFELMRVWVIANPFEDE